MKSQKDSRMSWGAIFDFDGVIVDTEEHHDLCWQKVAQELNLTITYEQFVAGFGVKNERFIREILGWTDDPKRAHEIAMRKEAIFQEHIKTADVQLVAGVDTLLEALYEEKVPCAIASSSIVKNIELLLQHSHIRKYFSHIISGEDVKEGKPNPECFLKAAVSVQMPPERCVVFEDALLGVEAAKRAKAKCVAITTTFDKQKFEQLAHKPDMIINKFNQIDLKELESWFR